MRLHLCNTAVKNGQGSKSEAVASTPSLSQSKAAVDLISTDFTNALKQLRAVPPSNTTIALLRNANQDVFVRSMYSALKSQGYGIRWVDDGDTEFLLQYRKNTESTNKLTNRDVYEVAIGFVEMRRTYFVDAGIKVRPATPLYVRGTDASNIVLNDDIFNQPANKPLSPNIASNDAIIPVPNKVTAQRIPPQSVPVQSIPAQRIPTDTRPVANSSGRVSANSSVTLRRDNTLPADANPLDGLVADAASVRPVSLPLVALSRIENVFELGGSNYEDLLAGHQIVAEQVLTFPNDSLRMGTLNKKLIGQMLENYQPQRDVISVIGCSLGPTKVKGGNAALALGRASRVVEALLFAGIDEDKILDEGCWAGNSTDKELPRRGVVVTLNRKI